MLFESLPRPGPPLLPLKTRRSSRNVFVLLVFAFHATFAVRIGGWTPAWPLSSKATRVSHGPDEIQEYAFVVVLQIGQVVGEAGEVVADASLQVLGNMTIDRGQRAAAVLIEIR
jgi:hypothetical protein